MIKYHYRGGLGAVTDSDRSPLQTAIASIQDQVLTIGRELGTARTQGAIPPEEMDALDAALTDVRVQSEGLQTGISTAVSVNALHQISTQIDSLSSRVTDLSNRVRSRTSGGWSAITGKTLAWSGVAVLAGLGGAFWIVRKASKRSRRRR